MAAKMANRQTGAGTGIKRGRLFMLDCGECSTACVRKHVRPIMVIRRGKKGRIMKACPAVTRS